MQLNHNVNMLRSSTEWIFKSSTTYTRCFSGVSPTWGAKAGKGIVALFALVDSDEYFDPSQRQQVWPRPRSPRLALQRWPLGLLAVMNLRPRPSLTFCIFINFT